MTPARAVTRLKFGVFFGAVALVAASCGGSTESGAATTVPNPPGSSPSTASPVTASDSSTSTTSITASTTAVPVRGVDWEMVSPGFIPASAVVVGDRLWVSGRDREAPGTEDSAVVLVFTDDGRTWEFVDLAGLDMPVRVGGGGIAEIQGQSVLANVDGDLYALFTPTSVGGVSADGVIGDMWLVTTVGAVDGEVVALGPADTGMDQRIGEPDRIDPKALKYTNYSDFRVNELGGIAGGNGQVHIVIDGNRWEPYATTDSDVTVFTLSGTELENVYNENKFGGGFIEYAGIAALGDDYVLVGRRGDRPRVLFSYVTTDGVDWLEAEADPPPGDWAEVLDLASNSKRLVAAGSERPSWGDGDTTNFPVSWWSDDGSEWNRVELPLKSPRAMRAVGAVWTGSEFVLVGADKKAITAMWTSPDGIEWSEMDTENLPEATFRGVAMWGDRVVMLGNVRRTGAVVFTPPLP